MKKFKIAYLGGGSKQWARTFMTDLALSEGLEGEIGLYDIDEPAAILNKRQENKSTKILKQLQKLTMLYILLYRIVLKMPILW